MTGNRHLCLVLGGARSGKSSWAERRLRAEPARYVATGYRDGDDEWLERLQRHRERRPPQWETLETLDLVGQLGGTDPRPVLVDCLTLWLTRCIDALEGWADPPAQTAAAVRPAFADLGRALSAADGEVVLVSNEVGAGVVAASPSGRLFADLLGELNCLVAQHCDEVVLMVAGIPVPVKGSPPPWRKE